VKFSSNNEGVATVDDLGPREDERPRGGRHHVLVFQPRAIHALTVPYPNQVAEDSYAKFPNAQL